MSRRLYDPSPRRRRKHRTHDPRKGIEPAGLKRYRLGLRRRRTADPGYMSSMKRGPRGGTYFAGPKKRRYDPAPRRFTRARAYIARHPKARRIAGKIESGLTRYGIAIGAGLGALAGILIGYDEYKAGGPNQGSNYMNRIIGGEIKDANGTVIEKSIPEIAHLWSDFPNLPNYLKYKFLGLDAQNKYIGSAWVIPFWVGVGSWIFSKLPLGSKLHRVQRPLGKIGIGVAGVSAFGALALPGSPQNSSGYGNIPSAARGSNEPASSPTPQDGRYHNI